MNTGKYIVNRAKSFSPEALCKKLPPLNRLLSLGVGSDPSTIRQKDTELSVGCQDVRGADSGCTSHPLAGSPLNNLEMGRKALARAPSLLPGNSTLNNKRDLPGSGDSKGESWQGIEHNLRQRNRDKDPESLTVNKKPFHQRTWFACSIYVALLALLVAAILALAFTRSVVMPRMTLQGEILSEVSTLPLQQNLPANSLGINLGSTNDGPTTMKLVGSDPDQPAESSASPEVQPTSTPSEAIPSSAPVVAGEDTTSTMSASSNDSSPTTTKRREEFLFILSLSGPLQRFLAEDRV